MNAPTIKYPCNRWIIPGVKVLLKAAVAIALLTPTVSPPAEASAAEAAEDALPLGAVFRLGTNRFRQEGEVRQVRYSDDGKKLASISRDSILIWNAKTGELLRRLRAPNDLGFSTTLSAVSFAPGSEEIAAADSSRVYVWEVDTGLELLAFQTDLEGGGRTEVEIGYSPNGKHLAVSGDTCMQIFNMTTGKRVKKLLAEAHNAAFYGLAWTPDGAHLSSATLDPSVVTWNVRTGELVRKFQVKNKDEVFSHSPLMSADGELLLAATAGMVDVWSFATGESLKRIETGADQINTLVLTPDKRRLIVGSQDGMIRVIAFDRGELLHQIDGRLWIGRSIAVSPDFTTVALGAAFPTIKQWDIETGAEKFPELTSTGHDADVQCLAYSPDGGTIASGGANKQIRLWDAKTGEARLRLPPDCSANHVAFTASGRSLLTSWHRPGVIHLWDIATGQLLSTFCARNGAAAS